MHTRPTVIDDLTHLHIPSDPQISADGTRIAYVLKTVDADKNRYETHIWVTNPSGDLPPQQWTFGVGSGGSVGESQPRWSPNGRYLAFVSAREEKNPQIYLLPTGGGEAQKATNLSPGGLGEMQWSPDSTRIAFMYRPQDEAWRESAAEDRKKNNRSAPPRIITRRHYREEGAGFVPTASYHLYLLDVETQTLTQITQGEIEQGSFCWSPDGARLAVVRNISDDPDIWRGDTALFVIPAREHKLEEAMQIVAPLGPKGGLTWSPDGSNIAYLGHGDTDDTWGVRNAHPWVAAVDGSGAHDLAPGWDIHAGNVTLGDSVGGGAGGPHWTSDSKAVLFLASERGSVSVYRQSIDAVTDPLRIVGDANGAILAFTSAGGETLALLHATELDTGAIAIAKTSETPPHRLPGTIYESESITFSYPTHFEATASDGTKIPCWALFPPDIAETPGPRPTILYIHGGPHLMYARTLFHEYQALAVAGYVVLYPNPRGSKGYGEAWTGAIKGVWGEPAMGDCMACVDHAISEGWADAARLGVAGGSYGGYLTVWIVGHTDRFCAAVGERGVYNLASMAGTCDFPWRDRSYFDADTTQDTEAYRRVSPLTYADDITTPLLIMHGEGDLRCPISQAEELFSALRMRGKEVVFVRYGQEGRHEMSRGGPPDLRIERQQRITAWFDQYLKEAKTS